MLNFEKIVKAIISLSKNNKKIILLWKHYCYLQAVKMMAWIKSEFPNGQ